MADYRARARDARDRVFAPSVHQTVTETSGEVSRVLLPELAEIRRILSDQGDAADEIAEIFGRTLARLSAEVADVQTEVARLRQQLEASQQGHDGQPGHGQPGHGQPVDVGQEPDTADR